MIVIINIVIIAFLVYTGCVIKMSDDKLFDIIYFTEEIGMFDKEVSTYVRIFIFRKHTW